MLNQSRQCATKVSSLLPAIYQRATRPPSMPTSQPTCSVPTLGSACSAATKARQAHQQQQQQSHATQRLASKEVGGLGRPPWRLGAIVAKVKHLVRGGRGEANARNEGVRCAVNQLNSRLRGAECARHTQLSTAPQAGRHDRACQAANKPTRQKVPDAMAPSAQAVVGAAPTWMPLACERA